MTYLDPKFNDLPIIRSKPVMTDADIEFVNDMDYFKRLLTVIVEQAAQGGHRSPWPDDLAYHFAWLEEQVQNV